MDLLERWWNSVSDRFGLIRKWVINADNGPENHSRRTQLMNRLVNWVNPEKIPIQLAYYPPYHSKYNPVEKTFGWLEQHWNGSLLDSIETVLNFAATLEFCENHPVVELVTQVYETGVKLTQKAIGELELKFQCLPGLEKWFVEIPVQSS